MNDLAKLREVICKGAASLARLFGAKPQLS
jgi:hypothetical protein